MAKSKNKSKMVKRGGANQSNSAELRELIAIDTSTGLDAVDIVCTILLYIRICSYNKSNDHYTVLSKKIKDRFDQRGGAQLLSGLYKAGQTAIETGQAAGQTALSLGQTAGQTALSLGQSAIEKGQAAGQTALSLGQSAQNAVVQSATKLGTETSSYAASAKNMLFPQSDDILDNALEAIEQEVATNGTIIKKKEIIEFVNNLDTSTSKSDAIQKCNAFNEKYSSKYKILTIFLKIDFETLKDISYPDITTKLKSMLQTLKPKPTSNVKNAAIGGYKKTRKMSKSKNRKSYKRRKSRKY